MAVSKSDRQKVFDKYGGHCAYCGCQLQKGWNVDHIEPIWHTWSEESVENIAKITGGRLRIKKGADSIKNYNPACPRCNKWKSTFSVEQFRIEISKQVDRLKRDSSNFRMALDYGLAAAINKPVTFFFETYQTKIENLKYQS